MNAGPVLSQRQRSAVTEGLAWKVKQVADVIDPASADYNALGPDEFFKKYNQNVVQVEGEVEGYSMSTNGGNVAILKTSTMPRIGFHPSQFGRMDANLVQAMF